jgi:hypothetical protein
MRSTELFLGVCSSVHPATGASRAYRIFFVDFLHNGNANNKLWKGNHTQFKK